MRESEIPKAGLGVFATQLIPSGVKFGPYKGQKVYYEDLNEDDDTSYMWEVYVFYFGSVKMVPLEH